MPISYRIKLIITVHFPGMQVTIVAALAVVIGVCVVGMSYMVYQKKRGKTASQYKPL